MRIPSFVLKKLYVRGSLRRSDGGLRFVLRNTLASATLTELRSLRVDNRQVPPERVRVRLGGREVKVTEVTSENPLVFARNEEVEVLVEGGTPPGKVKVRLEAQSAEFGQLVIEFEDDLPG